MENISEAKQIVAKYAGFIHIYWSKKDWEGITKVLIDMENFAYDLDTLEEENEKDENHE
jgi:hypothetical protein